MAFGRRKHDRDDAAAPEAAAEEYAAAEQYSADDTEQSLGSAVEEYPQESAEWDGDEVDGPFDIDDFETPEQAALARLDLGSVLIPMPPGRQIQVEFDQTGVPTAIWVVTANGRFTIAAYAAPKSRGLWREVAAELAEALRNDNAVVAELLEASRIGVQVSEGFQLHPEQTTDAIICHHPQAKYFIA